MHEDMPFDTKCEYIDDDIGLMMVAEDNKWNTNN